MSSDQLLQSAITAARAGRRKEAYDLLVQLVQTDDHNEQAWLWLAGVADDPEEQRICLDNVLHLNPAHAQAQQGMAWLDQHHPRKPYVDDPNSPIDPIVDEPPPLPTPPPSPPPPQTVTPANPPPRPNLLPQHDYPCPFCGAATVFEHKKCPNCRQDLMMRVGASGIKGKLGFGELQRINLVVDEREHVTHYNYGVTYKERGMWYMAAREWEGAVKKRPREVKYRRALGLAYAKLKFFDLAIATLREALELEPSSTTLQEDIRFVEQEKAKVKA